MRRNTASEWDLFAVAAPGLEGVVEAELRALGFAAKREPGGVRFRGDLHAAARANLWLRAASRVLLRVGTFDAPGRRELAARVPRLPWADVLAPGARTRVRVSSHASRLYHTGLIEEVLRTALPIEPAGESPEAELLVRIVRDRCTVSLDTSGELLHRRGYREETSRAPLRETLAAGMLLLCGYDGSEPFVDPMCGSGTLPLEAALIARRRAPGWMRTFAVERFPGFDREVLGKLRAEAIEQERASGPLIAGSDVHAGAVAAASRNAARAGLTEWVRFERKDVASLEAPAGSGLLVTNPPYGQRVGGREDARSAEAGLAALGTALEGPFSGWRAAVLLPPQLTRRLRLPIRREHALDNGGLSVTLAEIAPRVEPE